MQHIINHKRNPFYTALNNWIVSAIKWYVKNYFTLNSPILQNNIAEKQKKKTTVAYWDNMGCVLTQTHDRALQTFGRAFHFLFRLQKLSKLCCKFRAFIKCMKVTFYRPDYRKFFMCPLITNLSRVFFFKKCGRTFETLSRAFETLAFEGLREN